MFRSPLRGLTVFQDALRAVGEATRGGKARRADSRCRRTTAGVLGPIGGVAGDEPRQIGVHRRSVPGTLLVVSLPDAGQVVPLRLCQNIPSTVSIGMHRRLTLLVLRVLCVSRRCVPVDRGPESLQFFEEPARWHVRLRAGDSGGAISSPQGIRSEGQERPGRSGGDLLGCAGGHAVYCSGMYFPLNLAPTLSAVRHTMKEYLQFSTQTCVE